MIESLISLLNSDEWTFNLFIKGALTILGFMLINAYLLHFCFTEASIALYKVLYYFPFFMAIYFYCSSNYHKIEDALKEHCYLILILAIIFLVVLFVYHMTIFSDINLSNPIYQYQDYIVSKLLAHDFTFSFSLQKFMDLFFTQFYHLFICFYSLFAIYYQFQKKQKNYFINYNSAKMYFIYFIISIALGYTPWL